MPALSSFKPPVGKFAARHKASGMVLPLSARVTAGHEVVLQVRTLCDTEDSRGDVAAGTDMDLSELARRFQIASSIQHVLRRGCVECRERLIQTLDKAERVALRAEDPEIGRIIGVSEGVADMIDRCGGAGG